MANPAGAPCPFLSLCDVPPWVVGARAFNDAPRALRIQGVHEAHRFLFRRLEGEPAADVRARLFQDYVDVAFQLHHWRSENLPLDRRCLRNGYLRFLRGWMVDSNSVEGAVLKGWVESRLGLPPVYHNGPVGDVHSEAYFRYLVEKAKGSAYTNAILAQLDLLFEFVQHELRLRRGGERWETLYRGVYDLSEHDILDDLGGGRLLVRLNNLNSFTWDFERAWEFGNLVLEARVPMVKIFFRSDLLPVPVLNGEQEVLVVGGEYELGVRRW